MAKVTAKAGKVVKGKEPKAAKPVAGKKRLGKGARALVLLFVLGFVTLVLFFMVRKFTEVMNESKTIPALVDMEMGMGGEGPGHFLEPSVVAVDREGEFYVSDFSAHNVQKFDPNGSPIATLGSRGKEDGQFEQPSGLYVDPDDNLYVCDTFNHRIQKFDAKGKFVKAFSHSFFGPRSIVGNGLHRLYVSDTGNHKVQVFDMDGNFIKEWGGAGTSDGKFREPVGITADDKNNIYVADSDNVRIQKFDPEGKFLGAFKIATWKGKNDESPYLAFGQGALWAASTSRNAVLKLDPSGKLLAICVKKDKDGFKGAAGVAVSPLGQVYVVEKGKGQVARFTLPAVPVQAK